MALAVFGAEYRGIQFVSFEGTHGFQAEKDAEGNLVLLSPHVRTKRPWNELIVSWNTQTPSNAWLKVEVRALKRGTNTDFYHMGSWAVDAARFPRESRRGQKDQFGDVDTDTLVLNNYWKIFQLRLTLGGQSGARPDVRFLAVSLLDSGFKPEPLPPYQEAWGRYLGVPEKSQMVYPGGNVLCSPTTVSMILGYWSVALHRPELAHDVPAIQSAIHDEVWGGTGNWAFNMAFAGSLPGMRAYVTRLSDLAEVEQLVASGIPVGLSLCYDRLRGRKTGPSGHLVTCIGFTEDGQVIINDSGTSENVRKVFSRERVIDAWAHSKNTVYLVYPEGRRLPPGEFAHFDSAPARFKSR